MGSCSIPGWAHPALGSLLKAVPGPLQVSSRCPRTHMLCSAADSTDQSLCLDEMDMVYVQSGFLICCDFSLGRVLEIVKPDTRQEKTGQAAPEEIQTGGLSQMV